MSTNYFYTIKGARQGPATLDELKSLAARQELKRADLIWAEGMAAWQPAEAISDIFLGLPPDLKSGVQSSSPPPPLTDENQAVINGAIKTATIVAIIGQVLSLISLAFYMLHDRALLLDYGVSAIRIGTLTLFLIVFYSKQK